MATQTYTETLVVVSCASCHMPFGVTKAFERDRRDDHRTFYCPSGHNNFWPQQSDEEKLREQLQREERRRASLTAQLDQERARAEHNDRRVRGYQGALAKTKKRVAKGSCPACSCSFSDLAAHMAAEHPEYGADA